MEGLISGEELISRGRGLYLGGAYIQGVGAYIRGGLFLLGGLYSGGLYPGGVISAGAYN